MSIWTELFPEIQLSIYHDFFEIGGNSMLAMKMLSQLKKETGKHISFLLLNQFPTIESLAKLLNKENLLKIPNSLVSIRAEGHKTPLYLINGGELVADEFFNLGDVLDENQPIYGFQSNGFDGSGKLLETIEEIATYYIKGILSQDNYGPYCLAGYSVGGVIAFEMARQLKAMGRTVKLLAMIDSITRDPWLIKTKYSGFAILRLIGFNIYLLKDGLAKALKYSAAFVKAGLKTISNKFKSYEAEKPAENNNADTLDNFDVFSLHVSAYKKYKLEPYDGNIVVFRAKELTYYMDDFKYLGWRRYSKKTRSVSVRGDHFSIFDDENIQELGAKFQKILDTGY
jgi:thioesterase domain-containing protein/aryl carrier-like protein